MPRSIVVAVASLLALRRPGPVLAEGAPLAAEACLACHGPGAAGIGTVPGLAGRDRAELAAAMTAFRVNGRPATIMNRIARGYTEAETAAILDRFAGGR